jgi:hypothetical protein
MNAPDEPSLGLQFQQSKGLTGQGMHVTIAEKSQHQWRAIQVCDIQPVSCTTADMTNRKGSRFKHFAKVIIVGIGVFVTLMIPIVKLICYKFDGECPI